MMIETVPEESSGGGFGDSCSSLVCSSLGGGSADEEHGNHHMDASLFKDEQEVRNASFDSRASTVGQGEDSKIDQWRNLVLGAMGGTALILAIAAYASLATMEATADAIPAIFALVILLAFINVGAIFYYYDKQVQKRLLSHQTARQLQQAKNAAGKDSSKNDFTHVYAMSSGTGSVAGNSLGGKQSVTSTGTRVIKHHVTSLLAPLKNTFGGGGKSSSRAAALMNGGDDNANNHNNNLMNGMASTESLNNFLGAVRRQPTFLMADQSEGNTGLPGGAGGARRSSIHQTKSVAEFFPETTVLFADVQGFTAWSSVREPNQVFTLLESLFHAFDGIAQRRKVFKVETVGDCYVAVTGLPQPRKDHAVIMSYFARDCIVKMGITCRKLETQLGPDTGDLRLRIGLHSGAVTGGVLRGKRSRFQLFGDTVNTAARIESTGTGGKIHLSETTAELLRKAGKSHWVFPREDQIEAKGLGVLQTYFLQVQSGESDIGLNNSDSDSESSTEEEEVPLNITPAAPGDNSQSNNDNSSSANNNDNSNDEPAATATTTTPNAAPSISISTSKALGTKTSSAKVERLVSWNVDLLGRLLKQVVARRALRMAENPNRKEDADESIFMTRDGTFLDEVKETIELPHDRTITSLIAEKAKQVDLEPAVREQLEDYVRTVAYMYPNHAFHNFEHASHVTMSVAKLLSRIVAPSAHEFSGAEGEAQSLHDHTFGLTSDPLCQLSCVLSALIHDCDHPGVPNSQLVAEQTKEAEMYKGKSVAEQNSLDKCWNLLMEPRYEALRKTIYTTSSGLARFRSLLVNSVMATDICDKDLKKLRDGRWDRAFNMDGMAPEQSAKAANDRKATIVIEHLIQASDVSHTMQHWHVYRKWNERLFRECYRAYKEGRAAKDPSLSWYEGEKGFFDFYIIPLAKKLKECGVFGVSSSEYLDYAVNNRREWGIRGKEVVRDMVANVQLIERQQMTNKQTQD